MKFTSQVIHGQKHGRSIGYPTANLEVTDAIRQTLDKEGVYAVKARLEKQEYRGALFYGRRSLFADTKPKCEILLFDFVGDLYGQEIAVEVIKHLRPVAPIKDGRELVELIREDIKKINQLFNR